MIIGPVVLQVASSVATITLNRPDNDNKIDGEMTYALGEVCRILADDDELRLLVITASGSVFSANTQTTYDRDEGKDDTSIGPGAAVAALKDSLESRDLWWVKRGFLATVNTAGVVLRVCHVSPI